MGGDGFQSWFGVAGPVGVPPRCCPPPPKGRRASAASLSERSSVRTFVREAQQRFGSRWAGWLTRGGVGPFLDSAPALGQLAWPGGFSLGGTRRRRSSLARAGLMARGVAGAGHHPRRGEVWRCAGGQPWWPVRAGTPLKPPLHDGWLQGRWLSPVCLPSLPSPAAPQPTFNHGAAVMALAPAPPGRLLSGGMDRVQR